MPRHVQDDALEHLFPADERLPCPEGMALLRAFAEILPSDSAFLQPGDLVDVSNSAFIGIPEWAAFAERYGSCGLCNA